jgi:hypothetical protein
MLTAPENPQMTLSIVITALAVWIINRWVERIEGRIDAIKVKIDEILSDQPIDERVSGQPIDEPFAEWLNRIRRTRRASL